MTHGGVALGHGGAASGDGTRGQGPVEVFHEKINSDGLNCAMRIENLAEGP